MIAIRQTLVHSPIAGPMVLSCITLGLDDFIERNGGNPADILARAGLWPGMHQQPCDVLSLQDYCTALEYASQQTGIRNFGLWFGHGCPPAALGMLGYLSTTSRTLGEGLRAMSDSFGFHQGHSSLRLRLHGNQCLLEYETEGILPDGRRQDAELSLGMFCGVMKEALGPNWVPSAVHFQHTEPTDSREHREAFGTDVRFGAPCNTLFFARENLDSLMPRHDPHLHALIQQNIEIHGQRLHAPPQPLPERIMQTIGRSIIEHGREPRLEDIAAKMAIPGSRLRHLLEQHGVGFKTLVDAARQEAASEMLRDPLVSISELAYRLGYDEASSFSRAFKRWSGLSPRAWRERKDR